MAGEFLVKPAVFSQESAMNDFSRRRFFHLAGALGARRVGGFRLNAQQQYPLQFPPHDLSVHQPVRPSAWSRATCAARTSSDALLRWTGKSGLPWPARSTSSFKINNVSTTNQLAATHVEAIRASWTIGARFKGPVSSPRPAAGTLWRVSPTTSTPSVIPEYKKVSLVDLNRERNTKFLPSWTATFARLLLRLAARLMDPRWHSSFPRRC